jgi:hypothetical protein
MPDFDTAPRQLLKLLLLRPQGAGLFRRAAAADRIIAQLEDAGFRVEAEIVASYEVFEERLRTGRFDLAINGLQLATSFQMIEQQRRRADEAALEAADKVQAMLDTSTLWRNRLRSSPPCRRESRSPPTGCASRRCCTTC